MTNTAPAITAITYEFAGLSAGQRDRLEEHLRNLGFGPFMARKDRGDRREAARCLVALPIAGYTEDLLEVADAGYTEDLLELAKELGLAPMPVTNPKPGTTYLARACGVTGDELAERFARSLADILSPASWYA